MIIALYIQHTNQEKKTRKSADTHLLIEHKNNKTNKIHPEILDTMFL